MSFALVAYLVIAGQVHAFILDDELSYRDCRAAVEMGVESTLDNGGRRVSLTGAALVCEIET